MSPAGTTFTQSQQGVFQPQINGIIPGIIGSARKGPVNQLVTYTDEQNFVNGSGEPRDGHYGLRAGVKTLRLANQLKYVRIAGTLLATAFVEQIKNVGGNDIPILRFDATSAGTWANNDLQLSITLNGSPASSFNITVFFKNTNNVVERFENLTNSNVETVINQGSTSSNFIRVTLHPDAGSTLPDATIDSVTGVLTPLVFSGGNDGAFASSASPDSLTAGLGAQLSWTYTLAANTTTDFTNDEPRAIAPGSLVISCTAPVAESFTDNGDGTLTGSVSGTGRVDYTTGIWSVTFDTAPTSVVTVTYRAATLETIGALDAGDTSYSGTIAREGVVPDTLFILDNRNDQLDLGDGATTNFTPDLGGNILPGSIVITAVDTSGATLTITDDGDGNLIGDIGVGTNTINYVTGSSDFDFSTAPGSTNPINATFRNIIVDDGAGVLSGDSVTGTIDYETGEWALTYTLTPAGDFIPDLLDDSDITAVFRHATVLGFGDGSEVDFEGTLKEFPVKPGSVVVHFSAGSTLTDDGNGNLSGASGSGTVDYFTGEISVTFTGAPASGFAVHAYGSHTILEFVSIFPGPIGNRRTTLTDGLFVRVDEDPNTPATPEAGQRYRVRLFFNDGSGSAVIETFSNLTSINNLISVVNNEETGSELVRVEATGFIGEGDVETLNAVGGTVAGQDIAMAGAFGLDDIIGSVAGTTRTGLQLFEDDETVALNFLATPGLWHRQVHLEALSIASRRRLMYLFANPDFEEGLDLRDFANGNYNAATVGGIAVPTAKIPFPPLAAINSSHGFDPGGWGRYFDQYTDQDVVEPPEGDVLGIISRVAVQNGIGFTPAGLRRGQFVDWQDIRIPMTRSLRGLISDPQGGQLQVISPIIRKESLGIFLFDQKTMTRQAGPLENFHAQWTINTIGDQLVVQGEFFNFELMDNILFREVESFVDRILNPFAARNVLFSYRIICDSSNNPAETLALNKLFCDIFVQVVQTAREIEFRLTATPQGTDFNLVAPV